MNTSVLVQNPENNGRGRGMAGARAREAAQVAVDIWGESANLAPARWDEQLIGRVERGEVADWIGKAILSLAGGPEWGGGKAASATAGIAGSEARRWEALRGTTPSDSARDDAASAAAGAVWIAWRAWESVCGDVQPAQFSDRTFRRVLWRAGARAAFGALRNCGFTGDRADEMASAAPLDAKEIVEAVEELSAHFAGEHILSAREIADNEIEQARRAKRGRVARWLWQALVPAPARGAGAAQARRTGIQRAKLMIGLLYGRGMGEAAKQAGFAGIAGALKSVGAVWPALGEAIARQWNKSDTGAALAKSARLAARKAALAIRANRAKVGPLASASEWDRLSARAQAVEAAKFATKRRNQARAERQEQWNKAAQGWRAGWLRDDKR